jgi:hypothetical protein
MTNGEKVFVVGVNNQSISPNKKLKREREKERKREREKERKR